MADEIKNDRVIRRRKDNQKNKNKVNEVERPKKPWYKNKNKKYKKKFSIASTESLQQLVIHFNKQRY